MLLNSPIVARQCDMVFKISFALNEIVEVVIVKTFTKTNEFHNLGIPFFCVVGVTKIDTLT